ncbi:unnamed protein product, partial [Ectocarpus sp. 12 AP-2014]
GSVGPAHAVPPATPPQRFGRRLRPPARIRRLSQLTRGPQSLEHGLHSSRGSDGGGDTAVVAPSNMSRRHDCCCCGGGRANGQRSRRTHAADSPARRDVQQRNRVADR